MMSPEWVKTNAGVKIPWIIYGTAWKKDRTADLVEKAVQTGFRGIDTACQPKHYQEAGVGEALQRAVASGVTRESLFVQTKFTPISGQDPNQVPYDRNAPIESQVAQSFETSQKNLKTPYVDSFILHSPVSPYEVLRRAWAAMEVVQKKGGARQLGISNCYDLDLLKRLYADVVVKPAVVQNRFYADTLYDKELRKWCTDHNVIYQSFWTLTANPHILGSLVIQNLARKYEKTAPQIFFRYLNQGGIVPLTGTCSEQHMREDLTIFDFLLSAEEQNQIGLLL